MVKQNDPMLTFSSQVKRSVSVSGYKVRFDDGDTYTYVGIAAPGTVTSTASWSIKRLTDATGDVDWASGNLLFTKQWTQRETYSYS